MVDIEASACVHSSHYAMFIVNRFQVQVVGGTDELHDINVKVEARLHKTSKALVVALGEAMNITTDIIDASEMAWLTGISKTVFVGLWRGLTPA